MSLRPDDRRPGDSVLVRGQQGPHGAGVIGVEDRDVGRRQVVRAVGTGRQLADFGEPVGVRGPDGVARLDDERLDRVLNFIAVTSSPLLRLLRAREFRRFRKSLQTVRRATGGRLVRA